jgi:hypothetical protein
MPDFMTQKISDQGGKCIPITYYRQQTQPHVSHDESGAFTQDAKQNYATFNHLNADQVVEGTFKSSQGVPTGGKVYEI